MSNLLPQGWSYKCLSELALIDNESLKSSTDPKYKFKYVDIASVSTGKVTLSPEYISFNTAPSRAKRRVRKGDVLMSTVRPNLKAFAYFNHEGNDFVASTGFAVIQAKDGNNGQFLFNSIVGDDITRQIDLLVVGSNYPAINSSDVKNLEVLTPSKSEQQKIAKILTSVDEVIEKTQAQIDKLKDMKTGLTQELLTNGIGHTEFENSSVGRIPVKWEVKTLVDCSDKMTNGFVGATRGIYQVDGIPYVLCQNVKPNKFIEITHKYVNSEFHLKNIRAELKEGDVLTVQTGAGNGDTCVVPKTFEGANCHALIITRFKESVLNPYFFSEYMNSNLGKNRVSVIATGGAHPHLNTTDLRRELIPVPPIDEQNTIVATLRSIQKNFENLEKKNITNKNIKKALMQDLLTGKVRVKTESTNTEVAVG